MKKSEFILILIWKLSTEDISKDFTKTFEGSLGKNPLPDEIKPSRHLPAQS